MKKIYLILIVMVYVTNLLAQGTVSGYVVDSENNAPMMGVNFIVEGTNIGTTSDEEGFYILVNIPEGPAIIKISHIGYQTQMMNFTIGSATISYDIIMEKTFIESDAVVVTATKTAQSISNIPGRVGLVSSRNLKEKNSQTMDEILIHEAGLSVDRDAGILSHKAVVSIRGITGSEQGRVLALVDGTPVNKSDGGTINWNRINTDDLERVEIFKGPGSSIYGNNAMGGVINFISKKIDRKGIHGSAKVNYSDFNTFGQKINLQGRFENTEGFYFKLSGMNKKSDGYIVTKEEYRSEFDVKNFMEEQGINTVVGYDFTDGSKLETSFNFYDDKRSNGTKVKNEAGSFMKHKTYFSKVKYSTNIKGVDIEASGFYQFEKYKRAIEKYKVKNNTEQYDLIYVDADRIDMGASLNGSFEISGNLVTLGVDVKQGKIDGADNYQTSSDVIANKGTMNMVGIYLQDQFDLNEELKIIAGFRYDMSLFRDGEFILENPTSATDFMEKFEGQLEEYDWTAFTPRLAVQYKLSKNLKTYVSLSQGFRSATLDDLTRSGLISGGFKLANPELKPETMTNIEMGFNIELENKLFVMPSFYYMMGEDFLYYMDTGDVILGKKKILEKKNITKVNITGAELDIKYYASPKISFYANYTYTNSEINEFEDNPELKGKSLTYTPEHLANAGVSYHNNKIVNGSLNVHYQGEQFTSDDNEEFNSYGDSQILEDYFTLDVKLWKRFSNLIDLSVSVQNVLDNKYDSSYDQVSPGRFITAELGINF